MEVTFLFNVGAIWLVLWCKKTRKMRKDAVGAVAEGGDT